MDGRRGVAIVSIALLVLALGANAALAASTTGAGTANTLEEQASGAAFQNDAPANCSFPKTLTDATGEEVTLDEEPQRVVALGASAAQIAWSIGQEEEIVGMPVNPTTAYLDGSEDRTDIYQADDFTVATETVVDLEPDLVIAPNIISNETVSTLRDTGLTVFKQPEGTSLETVYDNIDRTGALLGACGAANETVDETRGRVSAIQEAIANESQPRVLYGTNYVAGNDTFIGDILESAGGENVAATAGISGTKQISNETVIQQDPQWLVVTSRASIPNGSSAFADTTALRENQTIVVNPNYLSQPGPRVVRPLAEIATALHPEAMAALNGTTDETATNETNGTVTNRTTTSASAVVGPTTTANGSITVTTAETGITNATVATDQAAISTTNETGPNTTTTVGTTANDTTTATTGGTATTNDGTAATDETTATTTGSGPGFGPVVAVGAVLVVGLLARRGN